MISHQKEPQEYIDQFDETYQQLKNDLRTRLNVYEQLIELLNKEIKATPLAKEIKVNMDAEYNTVMNQIREFNEIAVLIKLNIFDLEQERKESIVQLTKNQGANISKYYREGLLEAVKCTLREFKDGSGKLTGIISDLQNELKQVTSHSSYLTVTDIINKFFQKLSTSSKVSQPLVELLDKNISRLCAMPSGKFSFEGGSVFKIGGGTIKTRKLVWNVSDQNQFMEVWLGREIKIIKNIYKKKIKTSCEDDIQKLKAKQEAILNDLSAAINSTEKYQKQILKIFVNDAVKIRDQFIIESKMIYSQAENFKNSPIESKRGHDDHEAVQKLIFELTQVVKNEVKMHLKKPITKLFFQADLIFADLESKLAYKKMDLFKASEKALKDIQEVISRVGKTTINEDNYSIIQQLVDKSRLEIQNIQKPVFEIRMDYDKLKEKLTKILKREFPPVLETLKKINQVVQIVRDEVTLLRKKKETNLFKSSCVDKADRIEKALEVALENLDNIFQHCENDIDRINYFFDFKLEAKQTSLKEALNEKRIFYGTVHMYKRLQKKIAAQVFEEAKTINKQHLR